MVLIREGAYVISRTIGAPRNVTLSGVGFATKLVLADYADQAVIENAHPEAYVDSNIVIEDLQIDARAQTQPRIWERSHPTRLVVLLLEKLCICIQ